MIETLKALKSALVDCQNARQHSQHYKCHQYPSISVDCYCSSKSEKKLIDKIEFLEQQNFQTPGLATIMLMSDACASLEKRMTLIDEHLDSINVIKIVNTTNNRIDKLTKRIFIGFGIIFILLIILLLK